MEDVAKGEPSASDIVVGGLGLLVDKVGLEGGSGVYQYGKYVGSGEEMVFSLWEELVERWRF